MPSKNPRRIGALLAFVSLAAFAGCGASTPVSAPSSSTAVPTRDVATSDDAPSAQTRMICAPEAQEDLAKTLGLEPTSAPVPSWKSHVYACDYRYADGAFTLSVRQFANAGEARVAYAQLGAQLTGRTSLDGLGQRAITTANGSVIVQKDDDVLLVDIAGLPARFGVPADTKANAAISIAATIMGCWTGA